MKGKGTLEKYLFLNSEALGRRHTVYRTFCVVCRSQSTTWRARAALGWKRRVFFPNIPRPAPQLDLSHCGQHGPWSAAHHFVDLKTSGDLAPFHGRVRAVSGRAHAGRLLGRCAGGQVCPSLWTAPSGLQLPGGRSRLWVTTWDRLLSQGSQQCQPGGGDVLQEH